MAVTPLREEQEPPRRLPANEAVEQRLLGAILCDNKAYRRVAGIVGGEMFWNPVHQRIWVEIVRLINAGIEASPPTLASTFEDDQALKGLGGGAKYLVSLARCAVTITGAEDYAEGSCSPGRKP
jgi:replicative DNA helicase